MRSESVCFSPEPIYGPGPDDRYAGIRALWIKVIIRAVFDWVSYRDSDRLHQRKLAESAEIWLFQPSELFNAFDNICMYIDLDPERVRRWAKNMDRDQVAKIEHLERGVSSVEYLDQFRPPKKEPQYLSLITG